jgi:hypothetical protein
MNFLSRYLHRARFLRIEANKPVAWGACEYSPELARRKQFQRMTAIERRMVAEHYASIARAQMEYQLAYIKAQYADQQRQARQCLAQAEAARVEMERQRAIRAIYNSRQYPT